MAKITRFNGNVKAIASESQAGERYVFGSTSVTSDDLTDQMTNAILRGWATVGPSDYPPLEWFNSVAFTATQFNAYLHQMGIAEYNAAQEYHVDSICTYSGKAYKSTSNSNVGSQPDSLSGWVVAFDSELAQIARSLNILDSDIGYDTAGLIVKDYIYSSSQQVIYSAPALAIGKTISSVVGSTLNTTEPASYQLREVFGSDGALRYIAISNNTGVDSVNYLDINLNLIGEQYLHDATTEETYYSHVPLTGLMSSIGTDVNGIRTVTVGGTQHVIYDVKLSVSDKILTDSYIDLAVGDDWTEALKAALTLSSITGQNVLLPSPLHNATYSETIVVPAGVVLYGYGISEWNAGFTDLSECPGQMIFTGTGAKNYTFDNMSNLDVSGGSVVNPDAAEAYSANANNDTYEFTDFTNADAVGASRATLKPISVAIELKAGARLCNIRVVPDSSGIDNYNNPDYLGLAADWDIGVLEHQSRGAGGDNCQIVGYWRTAALAKLYESKALSSEYTNAENSTWNHSVLQGYRGILGRGNDTFYTTATTATSISIPWSASHTFDSTGTIRVGGADVDYTSLSFGSGLLTFTVASHSAGVGSLVRKAGSNFGSSGSWFVDCEIHDLMHSSRLMSCSTELTIPFPSSSCAIEISGEPSRALNFVGCTTIHRDDLTALMGNCRDIFFNNSYFEAANGRLLSTDGIFTGNLPNGGRFIAVNGNGANCTNLRFTAQTDSFIDFAPRFDGGSLPARFTASANLFNPREAFSDKYDLDILNGELRIGSRALNSRIYADTQTLFQNSSGNGTIKSGAGSMEVFSGLRVRVGLSEADCYIHDTSKLAPSTTGTKALGDPNARFTTVYSVNSPDVSSDETLKSLRDTDGVLSSAETEAAIKIARLPRMFQWIAEQDVKSGSSSVVYLHCSPMAQSVWNALESEGLNPFNYGFINNGSSESTAWSIQPQELLWMICYSQQVQLDLMNDRLLLLESAT